MASTSINGLGYTAMEGKDVAPAGSSSAAGSAGGDGETLAVTVEFGSAPAPLGLEPICC